MKNNISFFRHHTNVRNTWQIKSLLRKYDWAGYGKYYALLEMMAENEGCFLNLLDEGCKNSIAVDLDFDVHQFEAFIKFLSEVCKLITITEGKITADEIQEILVEVNAKRERQRNWIKTKKKSKADNSTSKADNSTIENEHITEDNSIEDNNTIQESIEDNISAEDAHSLNKKNFCLRKEKFKNELTLHVPQYGRDMIFDFFNYWSEPTSDYSNMKFETQQTWDTETRLIKWKKNEFKKDFSPPKNSKKGTSERRIEALKNWGTTSQSEQLNNIYASVERSIEENELKYDRP